MGASTTKSNSSQQTTSQPWSVAVPALQQVLGDATNLYDSGTGSGVYSGQRVAQLGDDSLTGLQMARDQAAADNSGAQGVSFAQNVMNNGGGVSYNGPSLDGNGLSAGTAGALTNLAGVQGVDTSALSNLAGSLGDPNSAVNQTAASFMNGSRDLTTQPLLEGLLAKSQQTSSAESNLSGMAAGNDLDPTKNAIFQNLVNTSAANALQAQKETFAASGRYGSGAFAGAANKAVNDTDTALYAQQYNQNVANQLSANSQIDAARQAASSLGTNITNAISGVQSTNNQQRLAGAGVEQAQTAQQAGVLGQVLGGNEFNSQLSYNKANAALGAYEQGTSNAMQNEQNRVSTALSSQGQALQAASMLPTLDSLRYQPSQVESNVGSVLQSQDQSNLTAAQQLYQEQQAEPWSFLGQYAGIAGGIGGMGSEGTSVGQQTTQTQQSLGSTLIGGLSSGLGLLGMTGAFGPVGAATGGIGGLSSTASAGGYLTPYLKSAASSIFGK